MSKEKKKEIGDYEFELAHRFKYHSISHMCITGLCPHCGGEKTRTDYCNGTRCEHCDKIVPHLLIR